MGSWVVSFNMKCETHFYVGFQHSWVLDIVFLALIGVFFFIHLLFLAFYINLLFWGLFCSPCKLFIFCILNVLNLWGWEWINLLLFPLFLYLLEFFQVLFCLFLNQLKCYRFCSTRAFICLLLSIKTFLLSKSVDFWILKLSFFIIFYILKTSIYMVLLQIDTCNGFYCENFKPNKVYKPKIWTEV